MPLLPAESSAAKRRDKETASKMTAKRDSIYLERAQCGDNEAIEALLEAYKPLVLSRASCYYLSGQERDDLIQEGMIALFKAIMKCPADRYESFSSYAFHTVNNRLLDLIRSEHSEKMRAILNALSLDKESGHEAEKEYLLSDFIEAEELSPEERLLQKEAREKLYDFINRKLSKQEREVLLSYSSGHSYREVAEALSLSEKSVDSSLQRARRKMRTFLLEHSGTSPC